MPALWNNKSIGMEGSQDEANSRTEARDEVSRDRTWMFWDETFGAVSRMADAASWALEALRQAR